MDEAQFYVSVNDQHVLNDAAKQAIADIRSEGSQLLRFISTKYSSDEYRMNSDRLTRAMQQIEDGIALAVRAIERPLSDV